MLMMTRDDGDERISETTMRTGAGAADGGCEGAGATGGIRIDVEVKANVTKMLTVAGAANDGCEGPAQQTVEV